MLCVVLYALLVCNELMNYYRNLSLEGAVVCVCVIGVSLYMSSLSVTLDAMLRHVLLLLDFVPEYKFGKY